MVLVLSPDSVCSTLLSSLGAGMATRRRYGARGRVSGRRDTHEARKGAAPSLAACRQRTPRADEAAHLSAAGGNRGLCAGAAAGTGNRRRPKAQRRAERGSANRKHSRPAGHGLRGHAARRTGSAAARAAPTCAALTRALLEAEPKKASLLCSTW